MAESVASRYRGRGVDRDDLVQVAYLGLINAAWRFDPDRGKDFASFACPTMSGEIKRHFRDHAWTVRPPRRVQEMHSRLSTAITDVAQRRGAWPSTQDLAEHLGVEAADVAEASASHECFTVSSLDYRRDDEDDAPLGDAVGGDDAGYDRAEALVALGPACCQLGTRDRRIVYLRFFRGWTQQEIADELGVSQMQISRLLSRILRQLRQSIGVTDDE
ncbi:sigma-70 family RNA polymerase sigma factor, partial [Haloactinopolyspora alba]|uniref:sigma-70 family RNA polymerase sigma factor n=1 Tax=Haloactinopolyspora alba TaxID=648780 RepID=UPI0023EA4EDA